MPRLLTIGPTTDLATIKFVTESTNNTTGFVFTFAGGLIEPVILTDNEPKIKGPIKPKSLSTVDVKIEKDGAGFIHSPNHPDPYDLDVEVIYHLTGEASQRISMSFLRLAVEDGFDYIIIKETGQPDKEFTGFIPPAQTIYSQSNDVYIHFLSDVTKSHTGFLLAYLAV
jgi:hypothetical protein